MSPAGWQLDDSAMRPAFEAMTASDDPPPGAVLALAVGGRRDRLDAIRRTLGRSVPGSETATACVVALGLLKDESPDTIDLLASRLSIQPERHVARVALMRIGA